MLNKLKTFAPYQMLFTGAMFITVAIQTRFLSITDYGITALVITLIELLVLSLTQWNNSTFVRFFSLSEDKINLINTAIATLGFMMLIGVACIFILATSTQFFEHTSIFSLILLFVFRASFYFLLENARINNNVFLYGRGVIIQTSISILLTLVLLDNKPTVNSALYSLIISYFIGVVFLLKSINWEAIKVPEGSIYYYKYGTPVLFATLITLTSSRSDRIVLAQFSDYENVGLYAGLASIGIGITSLLFTIVAQPLYPELSMRSKCSSELNKYQKKYISLLTFVTLPILLYLCLVGEELIPLLLGNSFHNINTVIFVNLIFTSFFINIKGHYLDHGFQFSNNTKYILYTSIITVITMIVVLFSATENLNALNISRIMLFLSVFSFTVTLLFLFKKGIAIGFCSSVIKTIFASLIPFFVILNSDCDFSESSIVSLIITFIAFIVPFLGITCILNYKTILKRVMSNENDS